jgi:thioredoxin 1
MVYEKRRYYAVAGRFDDSNFEQAKRLNKLVLLEFEGEGCVPCKMMGPVMERVENRYKGKLTVLKGNIENCPKTVKQFKIMSIPTIIIFEDGMPVERFTGMVREDVLNKKISVYLK